jgi:diguanylate cyclase (GGDEF)-like protein
MRELIKKRLLANLLASVSQRYDEVMQQNERIIESMTHKAVHDPLTGLFNRGYFFERLAQSLAFAKRRGSRGAVFLIDLDHFKTVNDTAGHAAGDRLLKEVATEILENFRKEDVVARLGGDEFAVLVEEIGDTPSQSVSAINRIGEKLLDAISFPHTAGNRHVRVSASIGVAFFGPGFTENGEWEAESIVRRADDAMYEAKRQGKSRLVFYDTRFERLHQEKRLFDEAFESGLIQQSFFLEYQPFFDAHGKIRGAEALIRWKKDPQNIIPPDRFIPFAEESRAILKLGCWVLEKACTLLQSWQSDPRTQNLKLSINCSPVEFMTKDFAKNVFATIERYDFPPNRLTLEITESLLLENVSTVKHTIHALRRRGISIALDDFGTGYSSLSYLRNFPIDIIKIDQSFIQSIESKSIDLALIEAIFTIADRTGIEVVIEGIETVSQDKILRKLAGNAFQSQGFLYAKPMALPQLTQMLHFPTEISLSTPQTVQN